MKEIRIHGRGGQGSVTAAELLAQAAFKDGMYSQAFPAFGVERRGAPVQAFCRIDDKKIRTRAQIYYPDVIIVQDSTLLEVVDVFSGLKEDGKAVINTKFEAEDLDIDHPATIITVDATGLAIQHLGVAFTVARVEELVAAGPQPCAAAALAAAAPALPGGGANRWALSCDG